MPTFRVHYGIAGANGEVPTHADVYATSPEDAQKKVRDAVKQRMGQTPTIIKTKACREKTA